MEVQFVNRITQDLTKFYHVLQSLDSDVFVEISESIMNSPQCDKYKTLKTSIVSEFRDSEEKRLKALLNQAKLGD